MLNNSYLLLDTEALTANAAVLQKELKGAKLVPVIKDDAYGLGAVQVARTLQDCGVDTFAVAHVSEGMSLRAAGVQTTIWVMDIPLPFQLDSAVAADLTLTLGSFHQLETLRAAAEKAGKQIQIQLKLDTGLHRIGFQKQELPQLAQSLKEYGKYLKNVGVFSHFATDFEAQMDQQLFLFKAMVEQLRELGMEPGLRHIGSSASLEQSTKYNLDAVRIGRRLYMDNPLQPTGRIREAASLRAWVTDIRERRKGDTLSYGESYHLAKDSRVGVLSVGYGDGLSPEMFERHVPVLIRGKRASLLACCMDQSFVDLSDLDCEVGDEVTIFGYDREGNYLSVQDLATQIGANEGCAITSALSPRVIRIER